MSNWLRHPGTTLISQLAIRVLDEEVVRRLLRRHRLGCIRKLAAKCGVMISADRMVVITPSEASSVSPCAFHEKIL